MVSVLDKKKTLAPHIKNILYPSLTEALILSKYKAKLFKEKMRIPVSQLKINLRLKSKS